MAWENVPRLSTVNGQNVLIDPASGIVTPVADAATPQFVPGGGGGNAGQVSYGAAGNGTVPTQFVGPPAAGADSVPGSDGGTRGYGGFVEGNTGGGYDNTYRPNGGGTYQNGGFSGGYGSNGGYGGDWSGPVPSPVSALLHSGGMDGSAPNQNVTDRSVVPGYFGAEHRDWGAQGDPGGSGGSGGLPDAGARLSAARSRVQSALGGSSGGGYGSSSYGSSTSGSVKTPKQKMHGPYAHGLDPTQAMGLTSRPTMMIPRVFGGLNPGNPIYNSLSQIPAGAMALLTGKGTPSSIANKTGKIYQHAGMTGDLPSTSQLMTGLIRGKGIEDMFQGVKAGKGDYESYYAPGYVSGQEPMSASEAAGALGPLLDAALYGEPLTVQAKYGSQPGGWGSYLIDKAASRLMKKPAGSGQPIYKTVGRRLFR